MIQTNEHLLNLAPLSTGKISFAVKATLSGLGLLHRILRELVGIRKELKHMNETKSSQGQLLKPKQAANALQISPTKLQGLKDKGVLIEGIHLFQDGDVVRYAPDIGKRTIEESINRPVINKLTAPAKQNKTQEANQRQTRNAFKEKK